MRMDKKYNLQNQRSLNELNWKWQRGALSLFLDLITIQ